MPQLQQYVHCRNSWELWKEARGAQKRNGIHRQQNTDKGRSERFGNRNQQVSRNGSHGKRESCHWLVWCQDPRQRKWSKNKTTQGVNLHMQGREMGEPTTYQRPMTVFWSRTHRQRHMTICLMKFAIGEWNVAVSYSFLHLIIIIIIRFVKRQNVKRLPWR